MDSLFKGKDKNKDKDKDKKPKARKLGSSYTDTADELYQQSVLDMLREESNLKRWQVVSVHEGQKLTMEVNAHDKEGALQMARGRGLKGDIFSVVAIENVFDDALVIPHTFTIRVQSPDGQEVSTFFVEAKTGEGAWEEARKLLKDTHREGWSILEIRPSIKGFSDPNKLSDILYATPTMNQVRPTNPIMNQRRKERKERESNQSGRRPTQRRFSENQSPVIRALDKMRS